MLDTLVVEPCSVARPQKRAFSDTLMNLKFPYRYDLIPKNLSSASVYHFQTDCYPLAYRPFFYWLVGRNTF